LITSENLVALLLIVIAAGFILLPVGISAVSRRRSFRSILHTIPAMESLKRQVSLSVENGKRLHISLGSANIMDRNFASSLAGLAALGTLTQTSLAGDRPAACTSGSSTLMILSQDSMKAVFRSSNAMDQYHIDQASLTGVTPFSYAAGAMPVAGNERNSANIYIGHFGPEIGLMNEEANRKGIITLAASDSLEAQAVNYVSADEALIGEELFAMPAYLQHSIVGDSSLRAQDFLRWGLIGIISTGVILKLFNISLGGLF